MEAQDAVPVVIPIIAGLVWLLRLEGRVNLHDSLHKRVSEDLNYIRLRIDSAISKDDSRSPWPK